MTLKSAQKLLSMLNTLEREHGLLNLDGHQRVFLETIVSRSAAKQHVTPNDLVDMNLTSRSSTYRKIAELRALNLITEQWINGKCCLSPSNSTTDFAEKLETGFKALKV
jgi:hypothetical protein